MYLEGTIINNISTVFSLVFCGLHIRSSSTLKYFKRGAKLNWPEGATSRESISAVRKLDSLKVKYSIHPSHLYTVCDH